MQKLTEYLDVTIDMEGIQLQRVVGYLDAKQ